MTITKERSIDKTDSHINGEQENAEQWQWKEPLGCHTACVTSVVFLLMPSGILGGLAGSFTVQ